MLGQVWGRIAGRYQWRSVRRRRRRGRSIHGRAPGTAPSLFDEPEPVKIEPTKTVTITGDDVKATELGEEIVKIHDRLRVYQEQRKRLTKGSDPWNELKARFDELKAERDKVGAPLRGIRGTEIDLYGERAVTEARSIRISAVRDLTDRPKFRPERLHAWFDSKGNLQLWDYPPKATDLDLPKIAGSP